MFEARTGQYPSRSDLGVRGLGLKCVGKRFEARGERFGLVGQRRVGRRRAGRRGIGSLVDQLVGEQQRGEQELARFGQGAEPGQRLAALAVDQPRGGAQILFLALAARDLIGPPGDASGRPARPSVGGLPDQLVELGDGFADLGAQLIVAIVRAAGDWRAPARSARARARRGPELVERPPSSICRFATHFGDSGQALTRHGSPDKGAAPPP